MLNFESDTTHMAVLDQNLYQVQTRTRPLEQPSSTTSIASTAPAPLLAAVIDPVLWDILILLTMSHPPKSSDLFEPLSSQMNLSHMTKMPTKWEQLQCLYYLGALHDIAHSKFGAGPAT